MVILLHSGRLGPLWIFLSVLCTEVLNLLYFITIFGTKQGEKKKIIVIWMLVDAIKNTFCSYNSTDTDNIKISTEVNLTSSKMHLCMCVFVCPTC